MSTLNRPDLEEFLSALNGFLDRQTARKNPSYLRFLEIFCRSVGAGVGHLLKSDERDRLTSIISFGLPEEFDEEFNRAHASGVQECPLDDAFRQKKVVAIVELEKERNIPAWFSALMGRYQFKSLVAVPLLGHTQPAGILCAYYQDVCLFDQGTLDRLMVLGRMVGAATEKSRAVEQMHALEEKEKILDNYIAAIAAKPLNRLQIYTLLNKIMKHAFDPIALVCGPIKKTTEGLVLTVVAGSNVPTSAIAHKFLLPPFVEKRMATGQWPRNFSSITHKDWGTLSPLVQGNVSKILCYPFVWRDKLQSAVMAWREDNQPFEKEEELMLARFSGITNIALNVL